MKGVYLGVPFQSGFVNIIGFPNVGKSTLVNALLGEKISIATSKAQTTRQRILGISTTDNYQLILSDTPGWVRKPAYELHRRMLHFIGESLEDADILLYLTDIETPPEIPDELLHKIINSGCPIRLAINKIDLDTNHQVTNLEIEWKKIFPDSPVFKISALTGIGIPELKAALIKDLPEHPPYFEPDQLTDRTERFIMSEIIREKIYILYSEEIPYSVEVVIIGFKEKENILVVQAEIWTERESQKAILLGKNGSKIKKLGILARKDAEDFFQKKIFLELYVKVVKDWRKKSEILNRLGYRTE